MTALREAAQQALEALEEYQEKGAPFWACDAAVAALRDALAQQARAHFAVYENGVCEVCRKSPQILEALEIGYAAAQAEAAQYHAAMAGYRPERHAEMDADVAKIAKAISAVKAALAQEAETTRAQRMRDEGYTRRPTLREMAQSEQERANISQNLQSRHDAAKLLEERRQEIAQPSREWQGLTTQEAMSLTDTAPKGVFYGCDAGAGLGIWIAAVAAAERALKEKNHG